MWQKRVRIRREQIWSLLQSQPSLVFVISQTTRRWSNTGRVSLQRRCRSDVVNSPPPPPPHLHDNNNSTTSSRTPIRTSSKRTNSNLGREYVNYISSPAIRNITNAKEQRQRQIHSSASFMMVVERRKSSREDANSEPPRVGLRVNKEITARFVRLVGATKSDGQEGEEDKSTHEILSIDKALQKANKANLDLVEVSPNASPPVCRLIDYETFRFEQKKREKEQKKKLVLRRKNDVVRELRITSRIDDHDLSKKTENANKFLLEGHKVLFRINFKNSKDESGIEKRLMQGKDVMKRVQGWLNDFELENEPTMVGPNNCTMLVRPARKK
jgi:translation initiation factor IF-3